jgi:hypothetical protein
MGIFSRAQSFATSANIEQFQASNDGLVLWIGYNDNRNSLPYSFELGATFLQYALTDATSSYVQTAPSLASSTYVWSDESSHTKALASADYAAGQSIRISASAINGTAVLTLPQTLTLTTKNIKDCKLVVAGTTASVTGKVRFSTTASTDYKEVSFTTSSTANEFTAIYFDVEDDTTGVTGTYNRDSITALEFIVDTSGEAIDLHSIEFAQSSAQFTAAELSAELSRCLTSDGFEITEETETGKIKCYNTDIDEFGINKTMSMTIRTTSQNLTWEAYSRSRVPQIVSFTTFDSATAGAFSSNTVDLSGIISSVDDVSKSVIIGGKVYQIGVDTVADEENLSLDSSSLVLTAPASANLDGITPTFLVKSTSSKPSYNVEGSNIGFTGKMFTKRKSSNGIRQASHPKARLKPTMYTMNESDPGDVIEYQVGLMSVDNKFATVTQ